MADDRDNDDDRMRACMLRRATKMQPACLPPNTDNPPLIKSETRPRATRREEREGENKMLRSFLPSSSNGENAVTKR